MNKLKFAAIVALGVAMALSPAQIAAQEAAKPLSLRVNLDHTAEGDTQVTRILPGGTGEALGFRVGDILLEADGKPMSAEVYNAYMKDKKEGDDLVFKVKRGDAVLELTGKGVAAPAQAARPIELRRHAEGAEVVAMTPNGPAAVLGLKVGDIVLEVGGKPISREVLQEYVTSKKEGDPVNFKVKRGGSVIDVNGTSPAPF